jgi:hypothetical protein
MAKDKKVVVNPTAESGYQQTTYTIVEDVEIEDGFVTIKLPGGREVVWFEHVIANIEIG